MSEQGMIQIDMLGGFGVTYGGKDVTPGRNAGAKFLSFLQMLLLSLSDGLSREDVVHTLFADADVANISNSLNNLVYQTRKQLERAGLPADTTIRKKKDRYYLVSAVPVSTDVDLFLQSIPAPEKASEDTLRQTLSLYSGDLLPGTKGIEWIDERRVSLADAYKQAIADLAQIYRKKGDARKLTELYAQAVQITSDEEALLDAALIRSLIDIGDTHAAFRHYDRTLRSFQSRGRGRIPEALEECARLLSLTGNSADPVNLRSSLRDVVDIDAEETEAEKNGAFYCNYPSFIDAVKLLRRNLPRDHRPATLMLLTLVDYEGKPLSMKRKQEQYSRELHLAIHSALRIGDSFTRHDEISFLVLLPGADEDNAVTIYNRIARKLKEKAGSNTAVRYRMLSLNAV